MDLSCLMSLTLTLAAMANGLKVALVAGGEKRSDIKILHDFDPTNQGYDCSHSYERLKSLPHVIKGPVGLLNGEGKPMVCGGQVGSEPTDQCHVYEVGSNSWVEGPKMLEPRSKAAAVEMPDGSTWIFGGRKGHYAEMFDPASNTFKEGPKMPFSWSLNPCASLTPRDTILFLGRGKKSKENNKFYEFFPSNKSFAELPDMPGMAFGMICGADDSHFASGELYLAIGGWIKIGNPTGDAYVYSFNHGNWTAYPDKFGPEHRLVGSATLPVRLDTGEFEYALALDGYNPNTGGNERFRGELYYAHKLDPRVADDKWASQYYPYRIDPNRPRKFPAAVWVELDKVCPPRSS